MALSLVGYGGSLRAGGREAAVLGEWSYEGVPAGWKVHAEVVLGTPLLRQADVFELRLEMHNGGWRLRGARLTSDIGSAVLVEGTDKWEVYGVGKAKK